MDIEKNSQSTVFVRPFCPMDASQIHSVYYTGLVNGVDSAGHFAITRAFQHWVPMYLAYVLLISGGCTILFSSQRDIRLLGLAIILLSCSFMLSVYYQIRTAFLGYYHDGLRSDMSDIANYYRLDHEKQDHPMRCFWVAEVPSATSESGYEVVGCVALDCSLKHDEPMTGELRRLFVLPAYRKRGIGTMLMQTVISYAKKNRIPLLQLETTNFQPVARELYTRQGWSYSSTTESDFQAGGMTMNFIRYRLQLQNRTTIY